MGAFMIDKDLFSQAVTITAAFVANGDIRVGKSFGPGTDAMARVQDLVKSVYSALQEAQQLIDAS